MVVPCEVADMKRFGGALIVGLLLFVVPYGTMQQAVAQRYGPNVQRGLVYGTAETFDGRIDTLRLDLFKPPGGSLRRPLLVWVHGGGFSSGRRQEMDLAAEMFTYSGYVCASISYRLGFHRPAGLDYPFAYDSAEVIRATMRAVQDLQGALRFLAGRAEMDSIDVSRCVIGGASAGAITALHVAFADEDERPALTRMAPDVVIAGRPTVKRGDLGPSVGTLNTQHPMPTVIAVVSLLGAIDDTSWIDADERIPVYQYHQQGDPVVGCSRARGLWGLPFGISDNYPVLFGSCVIDAHLQRLHGATVDRRTWIVNGVDHDLHDRVAVFADVRSFLDGISTSTYVEPDRRADDGLVISPNPANGSLTIRSQHTMRRVVIADQRGKVYFDHAVDAADMQINVGHFPQGLYAVTVDGQQRLVLIGH